MLCRLWELNYWSIFTIEVTKLKGHREAWTLQFSFPKSSIICRDRVKSYVSEPNCLQLHIGKHKDTKIFPRVHFVQIFLTSEMCSLIGRGEVLCKNGKLGGGGGQGFLIKGAEWGGVGKEQTRSCISLWGKEWGVARNQRVGGGCLNQGEGRERNTSG